MSWRRPPMAWPRGQVEDLVRSLPPGQGRLHWQRFPDGHVETHWDQFDPDRGLGEALLHLLTETAFVPIAIGVLAMGGIAAAAFSSTGASRTRRRRT